MGRKAWKIRDRERRMDRMNDKPTSALSTAALSEMITTLAGASPARDDAERIDRIRHFEELKAAIAAAQARETVAFAASQRALDRPTPTNGIPVRANRVEQSIAHQVALARRCSTAQAL